jgi:hypothetical protein
MWLLDADNEPLVVRSVPEEAACIVSVRLIGARLVDCEQMSVKTIAGPCTYCKDDLTVLFSYFVVVNIYTFMSGCSRQIVVFVSL